MREFYTAEYVAYMNREKALDFLNYGLNLVYRGLYRLDYCVPDAVESRYNLCLEVVKGFNNSIFKRNCFRLYQIPILVKQNARCNHCTDYQNDRPKRANDSGNSWSNRSCKR